MEWSSRSLLQQEIMGRERGWTRRRFYGGRAGGYHSRAFIRATGLAHCAHARKSV